MIYLDNFATTKVDERVMKEMEPYYTEVYGNPGSLHAMGRNAKEAVEDARYRIAKVLGSSINDIIFTGNATESINLAIKGVASAKGKGHIITTAVEHTSVLEVVNYLETKGFDVTILPVDGYGRVGVEVLEKAIREDTILVSVIYGNNEIGTINDIKSLGEVCKKKGVLFHTDACQAYTLNLDVNVLNVDLLTLNGSKMNGPKGIGVLFRREGIELEPLIHGGDQEFGLRGGTLNVPGIIGLAKALEIARAEPLDSALRDRLIEGLLKIPGTLLNGHPKSRVPGNVNVIFLDLEAETLLEMLDKKGICASRGSACSSYKLEPNHVILAIGIPAEIAHGAVRLTLSKETTKKDIDHAIETVSECVRELRAKSPVQSDMEPIVAKRNEELRSL